MWIAECGLKEKRKLLDSQSAIVKTGEASRAVRRVARTGQWRQTPSDPGDGFFIRPVLEIEEIFLLDEVLLHAQIRYGAGHLGNHRAVRAQPKVLT